jgi:AcrR family transcriptional regulator
MTKQRLQEEALRLFAERGFDNVTVEEVAAAAGVSHMTFFRHFPTKESVILEDPYDPVIRSMVADQPVDLPAMERVRRGLLEAWGSMDQPGDEETLSRIRIASEHPKLRAAIWENNLTTEDAIVGALLETGVAELEARVAAGACLGALTSSLLHWAGDDDRSLGSLIKLALDQLALVS